MEENMNKDVKVLAKRLIVGGLLISSVSLLGGCLSKNVSSINATDKEIDNLKAKYNLTETDTSSQIKDSSSEKEEYKSLHCEVKQDDVEGIDIKVLNESEVRIVSDRVWIGDDSDGYSKCTTDDIYHLEKLEKQIETDEANKKALMNKTASKTEKKDITKTEGTEDVTDEKVTDSTGNQTGANAGTSESSTTTKLQTSGTDIVLTEYDQDNSLKHFNTNIASSLEMFSKIGLVIGRDKYILVSLRGEENSELRVNVVSSKLSKEGVLSIEVEPSDKVGTGIGFFQYNGEEAKEVLVYYKGEKITTYTSRNLI